ncbi:amylo-alpha-1,6-glucosidase [Streptomyces flavofungini]|uniref:Aminotransferase n=1 Tax=Streptomyces flavofungini TaxID=68200 RepID=A0ABS0XB78_9ACTN|nr:glycogen debranching N-terminal domain-containing protein [Streptomyces flavofungini]MBJ3810472.1 aminotransferase [Streptomyces flavofungini]GHC41832.1 aminotransferase [Streptomyces flavofungini]
MTDREHQLLVRGATFAAVGAGGDIRGVPGGTAPDGLFVRDARHLSRWQLTVDGAVPEVLTPATAYGPDADADVARCVLVPRGGRQEPPAYTLFREQAVVDGALVEALRITSNRPVPTTLRLALTADADFTDQFELRADHRTYTKTGAVRSRRVLTAAVDGSGEGGSGERTAGERPSGYDGSRAHDRHLPQSAHPAQPPVLGVEFGYRRGDWLARTTVTSEPAPDAVEETGTGARRLVWALELAAHGSADMALTVMAGPHGGPPLPAPPRSPSAALRQLTEAQDELTSSVTLPGSWPELTAACTRGLADLASLQVPARGPDGEELSVPAAGVPWFLTLLGRDALMTSLFALPYVPRLAAATLPALAATQATEHTEGRVAQPGKIVHEVRHGELAHFGQVPFGRYYGSVDATPLFLVLLGAYTEQTGDTALARRLQPHARAAVGWMLDHGGLTARGYLVYRADEGGLANQNWKDSPGAICDADGTRTLGPVMAAGAQGYAYDALRRTAWLARTVWDDEVYAALLTQTAADLRDRFQRDFWMPSRSFPALALDGEGGQVDALASDAGHLLWSGLLDKEYGEAVGRRLLEPDFFSGWGVRTLASGQGAYHPLSYHRGSVWPHDNALITLGLARYGLHDEARAVAHALVDAAATASGRLPEVLAGYERGAYPAPVPYPHACVRESRSAAAPLALLTAVGGA